MGRRIQADEMKWKIMLFKKKRDQLKEAVAWGNEEVKSYRELLLRSQEETQRLQRRAGRHQEKRDKIDRHNRRLVELLERRSREQHNKLSQLAALRRDHIQELITHIFHMQEEKQSSRSANIVQQTATGLNLHVLQPQ
ncbi:beclin 1-associated autophagy-related key regulator-like [Poecilia latipinna]|uniref:beclin 1-associated autophagy-related key regulator-like n=1 Tax=Poecilia latipinna TaxID=48699 RepID=UPI00072DABB5|nr:PREDICTED: beclin 1-associated autophagy-related key regulator-like [Poecilia latipinna]